MLLERQKDVSFKNGFYYPEDILQNRLDQIKDNFMLTAKSTQANFK